jgi:hypothetical protein
MKVLKAIFEPIISQAMYATQFNCMIRFKGILQPSVFGLTP